MEFAEVNSKSILMALESDADDFEDAVVAGVAKNIEADIILTRNIGNFKHAEIKTISPSSFLKSI